MLLYVCDESGTNMGQTALYCRVSTEEQNLDRQRNETYDYAVDNLDVNPATIEVFSDKSTGRDTERDAFQELNSAIQDGGIDRVVVLELTRLTRSMRDLSEIINEFQDYGTGLHIVDRTLDLDPHNSDPMSEAFIYLTGVFAQLEADMMKKRTLSGIRAAQKAGKHTGRPPYGFDTDTDGFLVPNENFDTALAIIERIEEEDESIRSTARHAGIARSTVRNIVDRKDLYLNDF